MTNQPLDYSILFVHIPKNAGSSVLTFPFVTVHGSRAFSPEIPKKSVGAKVSFAICRDPYARFTSAVFNHAYLGDMGDIYQRVKESKGTLSYEDFQNEYVAWLKKFKFAELQNVFEEWVLGDFSDQYEERFKTWDGDKALDWPELHPQCRYVYYNDKLAVDQLGRVEEGLDGTWKLVCELAGEAYAPLPRVNESRVPEHEKYHTEKTREVVRKVYAEDFWRFGYEC